jgi:hypothetical protein
MAARVQNQRQRLYGLLAIGKRDLGWTEDQYRQHLAANGAREHRGRPSATTMSYAQIETALKAMETAGWQRGGPAGGSILTRCHKARQPQWRKVIALWCTLADAGVVRERGEAAMLAWCVSHIRESRIEWAGAGSLSRCIEGLRSWAARAEVDIC